MTDEVSRNRVRMARNAQDAKLRALRESLSSLAAAAQALERRLARGEPDDRLGATELQNLMSDFSRLEHLAEEVTRRRADASGTSNATKI